MNPKQRIEYLNACSVLQFDPQIEMELAKKFYRALIGQCHPDRGGSVEKSQEVNAAWDIFCKYRPSYQHQPNRAEQQQSQQQYSQPSSEPNPPTRHHDIYAEVMGFQVNVSAIARTLYKRQQEVAAKKAAQKKNKR